MKYYLPVIFILFFSCNAKKKHETLEIDYLGQEKPGNIPQVFGVDIVSVKGRFDMGLTISPDGKNIAFGVAHESIPEQTCIYLMNYTKGKWTPPDNSFLPDNISTFFPMFDPSGNKLYFARSTDGSETDLWVAKYLDNKAIDARPLDSIFNSNSREAGHGKSKSGSFYFTSNRDDQNQCCGDIYHSQLESEGCISIQKVDELSSVADEESLFLSPNEDYIIIQAWKNEFQSKHDLYISYRTKEGSWTVPERLNAHINSKEIEQRPFVSPDNKFLFFSRMAIIQENGKDVYESDIYWVSTTSIFKPYPYHTEIDGVITYNEQFQLKFPSDVFNDVDDTSLVYQACLGDGSELPQWITFDSDHLSLNGIWQSEEPLIIKLIATDMSGNKGEFKLQIGVSAAIPNRSPVFLMQVTVL